MPGGAGNELLLSFTGWILDVLQPHLIEKIAPQVDGVRAMIRRTPPRGYAGCCHAISALDLTDRLSAIKLWTLIVVGEDDQGTPVAASQAIQSKIAGSQLEILKSAAHLSNMEQPEAFTQALTGFLSQVA